MHINFLYYDLKISFTLHRLHLDNNSIKKLSYDLNKLELVMNSSLFYKHLIKHYF